MAERGFANPNDLIHKSLHMTARAQHPGFPCDSLCFLVFPCGSLCFLVVPCVSLWFLVVPCGSLDRITDCLKVGPYIPATVPGNKLCNSTDCQVVISQACCSK